MGKTTMEWQRSSFCSDGACVEVAPFDDGVAIRDSKNPNEHGLWFPAPVWNTFVSRVLAGEFRSL